MRFWTREKVAVVGKWRCCGEERVGVCCGERGAGGQELQKCYVAFSGRCEVGASRGITRKAIPNSCNVRRVVVL